MAVIGKIIRVYFRGKAYSVARQPKTLTDIFPNQFRKHDGQIRPQRLVLRRSPGIVQRHYLAPPFP
jgi:hypothetical protein